MPNVQIEPEVKNVKKGKLKRVAIVLLAAGLIVGGGMVEDRLKMFSRFFDKGEQKKELVQPSIPITPNKQIPDKKESTPMAKGKPIKSGLLSHDTASHKDKVNDELPPDISATDNKKVDEKNNKERKQIKNREEKREVKNEKNTKKEVKNEADKKKKIRKPVNNEKKVNKKPEIEIIEIKIDLNKKTEQGQDVERSAPPLKVNENEKNEQGQGVEMSTPSYPQANEEIEGKNKQGQGGKGSTPSKNEAINRARQLIGR